MFVLNWLTLGGAERQALLFADELLKRGHKVTFVGLSTPGMVQDICTEKGIPCHYWPFHFPPSYKEKYNMIRDLAQKIKSLEPDYIAPYDMVPNLVCALFWRYTGAKAFVWQQRDGGLIRRARILERIAIFLTPRFISNSEHAVEWMTKELGVPRRKVRVVRNGVVLPPPAGSTGRPPWRKKHGIADDKKLVTMVANIHHNKDHKTLISAWQMVIEHHPQPDKLMLVLAGNKQSSWPEIEAMIKIAGLEPYVYAPGVVEDVSDLIEDTDLVVFCSYHEGVPNAILEGMAHYKPIVAPDIPGVLETGIGYHPLQVFDVNNTYACADSILYLLDVKDDVAETGQRNREIIESRFGLQRMVDETISVFEEIDRSRN